MSRFYVPKENIHGGKINITGKEAHHVLNVMRIKQGDEVRVFDGTGREYTGFIKNADEKRKKALIEIVRTEEPFKNKPVEVTLAQAIPKKKKMEYIVEKATELGASSIIPLITERTIVRPGDEKDKKNMVERWRRLSLEASKQCGRAKVPEIGEMALFPEFLGKTEQYDLVLMASLGDNRILLKEALKGFINGKILLFIGPEGDFTPEEIKMMNRENCKLISLGDNVLKSDTAGLFVLSAIFYEFSRSQ